MFKNVFKNLKLKQKLIRVSVSHVSDFHFSLKIPVARIPILMIEADDIIDTKYIMLGCCDPVY